MHGDWKPAAARRWVCAASPLCPRGARPTVARASGAAHTAGAGGGHKEAGGSVEALHGGCQAKRQNSGWRWTRDSGLVETAGTWWIGGGGCCRVMSSEGEMKLFPSKSMTES